MARLIDANLLVKQFLTRYTEREKQGNYTFVACEIKSDFRDMMDEMPTVDAVPVVHGKWILCDTSHPCDSFKCSECGIVLSEWATDMRGMSYYRNFCPNCGAKMDLEGAKMYKSPIEVFYGEIETKMEGDIFKAVQSYGINVNKEELIHALQYDRNQYQNGYADGYADGVYKTSSIVLCKDCKWHSESGTCHVHISYSPAVEPEHFCSYGERLEK